MPCMIASSDGDTAQWTSLAWPSDGECEDVEGRSRSAKGDESGLCNLYKEDTERLLSVYMVLAPARNPTRPTQPENTKTTIAHLSITYLPCLAPASRSRQYRSRSSRGVLGRPALRPLPPSGPRGLNACREPPRSSSSTSCLNGRSWSLGRTRMGFSRGRPQCGRPSSSHRRSISCRLKNSIRCSPIPRTKHETEVT